MKKIIFFLLLLASVITCFAQDIAAWQNLRISALTPEGFHYVRCETIGTQLDTLDIFYKKNDVILFDSMQNFNLLTLQQKVQQPDSDTKGIGLRLINDFFGYMQPLKLDNNTTVSSLHMVIASRDSINEVNLAGNLKLDLESFHFAFSDEKLYAGLKNRQGSYPNYDFPIIGPYYLYGAGFINPENVMDTTGYALIYANIPSVFTPGLYKIHGVDFTNLSNIDFNAIQRVGDITTTISDGILILKCDQSLIFNDPDFGAWPSMSNTLAFVPFTVKVNPLDLQNFTGDIGNPAMIRINDLIANDTNQLPILSNPQITLTSNTSVVTVDYNDPDGNFPFTSTFTVNGVDYPMQTISPDYSSNVTFSVVIPTIDWVSGVCNFSDDSTNVVALEILNEVQNTDITNAPAFSFSIYPNPINNNKCTLSLDNKTNDPITKINLYNIRGQLIKSFTDKFYNQKISLSLDPENKLSSGVYFIKLNTKDASAYKKIIIVK